MLFLSLLLVVGFFVQGLSYYDIRTKGHVRLATRPALTNRPAGFEKEAYEAGGDFTTHIALRYSGKQAQRWVNPNAVRAGVGGAAAASGTPPPPPPDAGGTGGQATPADLGPKLDAEGVPEDFNWQAYVDLYPDLEPAGINTEEAARKHYLEAGRREGRMYKPIRVLLRYTACTGLMNQHYSHIHAFALAAMLGSEVVLPPGAKRSSYEHKTSLFKEQNVAQWTAVPMESMWDVEHIREFWGSRGMTVHATPALEPFPDLAEADVAFPLYEQPGVDPSWVVRLTDTYIKPTDMDELVKRARHLVFTKASELQRAAAAGRVQVTVVLDLPCTFFMVRTTSAFPLVTEVARSIEFAPALKDMAQLVVDSITNAGKLPFNAVHLRIEKDAEAWADIMGGKDVVWNGYADAMRAAQFDSSTTLYVASALLTYGAKGDLLKIIRQLKEEGFCSEVHFKEMYIAKEELDKLHSEQVALVDFLVLAAANRYVGFGASTFSFYLREYRLLQGKARDTTAMVNASVITTDPLFFAAALIAPFDGAPFS